MSNNGPYVSPSNKVKTQTNTARMASREEPKPIMLTDPGEIDTDVSVQAKELRDESSERIIGGGGDVTNLTVRLEQTEIDSENEEPSEKDYQPPKEDPYKKAVKYMEMHNVMQIFQHLTSEIVHHRPVDPLEYMLEELQRMRATRIKELNS